jgi:putative secretion ATPase (PEP-CTERM system associated)
MYEHLYGFTEKPFTLLPDPSFLYLGKMHSTAYAMLEYGLLSQAGFTVITGEVGSGKTTLIRHLLNQIEEDLCVGLVSNSHGEMGELLKWVLLAFDLDYAGSERIDLHDRFTKYLVQQYAQHKRTVLIIDEAQNLSASNLEELRLLSNINADKNQVLQIILVGQPELREMLQDPRLLQFKQRVSIDYHLSGLSEEETAAYIHHRVQCAGRQEPLFMKNACAVIYRATQGIPRLINTLCDMVLVYGFVDERQRVDEDLVKDVLDDKKDSALFLQEPSGKADKPLEQIEVVKPADIKPNHEKLEDRDNNRDNVTHVDADSAKQLFSKFYNEK